MRTLLKRLSKRPVPEALASALIEFSQGKPEVLTESLRLVELEGNAQVVAAHNGLSPLVTQVAMHKGGRESHPRFPIPGEQCPAIGQADHGRQQRTLASP